MADAVRMDRWLWGVRLLKTRADAAEAARGGHVLLNGRAVKPAHDVKPGDRIRLRLGTRTIEVDVLGLVERRVSAPQAQELYAETDWSVENREVHAEARRLGMAGPAPERGGRPTKRDRRRMDQQRGD